MSKERKTIKIELPMAVDCIHPVPNSEEEIEVIPMDIEVDDPEVPSYIAKCPKCGREVVIDFNP